VAAKACREVRFNGIKLLLRGHNSVARSPARVPRRLTICADFYTLATRLRCRRTISEWCFDSLGPEGTQVVERWFWRQFGNFDRFGQKASPIGDTRARRP